LDQNADFSARYRQTPQCVGAHKSRILFDGKATAPKRTLFEVTTTTEDGKLVITLDAGEVQGITKGATFDVFASKDAGAEVVCRLISGYPSASRTTMSMALVDETSSIPQPAWALQTRVGEGMDIAIFVPLEQELLNIFVHVVRKMGENRQDKRNIRLVKSDEPHELRALLENGKAAFEITDKICVGAGVTRLLYPVSFKEERIQSVLEHAADFFFHLRRSNKKAPLTRVSLQAFELRQVFLRKERSWVLAPKPVRMESGEQVEEDLNRSGMVQLEIDGTKRPYGFRLVNRSNQFLYAWAFMFDISDLSIRACIPCILHFCALSMNI
jgi:hypothetical protein